MNDDDLQQAAHVVEESALDRAAGAGSLHWPGDPVADPRTATTGCRATRPAGPVSTPAAERSAGAGGGTPFPVGTPAVLRSVFDDHVGAVFPVVVVADDDKVTALYQPPGTTVITRTGRRGGPHGRNMYPDGWDGGHETRTWRGSGVLRVHHRGEPWSVWRWRDGDRWRPGCYVNLEQPWVRTAIGFDTTDWVLDLVVDGDGVPTWKDDDELDWCEAVGSVTTEHAARVRRSGDQALTALRNGDAPFAVDWDRWPVDAAAVPGPAALRRATTLVV